MVFISILLAFELVVGMDALSQNIEYIRNLGYQSLPSSGFHLSTNPKKDELLGELCTDYLCPD